MARLTNKGFTLIELVTVLVILSILAVVGSRFVVSATRSYQLTQHRAHLTNTGRLALERMTRQLRGALPHSLRITDGGECLQFFPIAAGGKYLADVPSIANQVAPTDTIAVMPHDVSFGNAQYVSIGAMSSQELYGGAPASLVGLSSRASTSLNLNSNKQWARNSISRRFYLLDEPQAFCLRQNQLRFYRGLNPADPSVTGSFDLLANNAAPVPSHPGFALSAGSENRSINVSIRLAIGSGDEQVSFIQEVLIRNVP